MNMGKCLFFAKLPPFPSQPPANPSKLEIFYNRVIV